MNPGPGTGPGFCRAYYFKVEIQLGSSMAAVVLVPIDSVVKNNMAREAVDATA